MERRWESFNGDRCCSFRRREVLCPDTASTAYIIRSVPYCLGLTAGPGGCFAATGRFEPPDQCKASPNWDLGGRPGPSEPTSGLTRERERERARRPSKMEPTLEPAGNHLARPTPTQPAPAPPPTRGTRCTTGCQALLLLCTTGNPSLPCPQLLRTASATAPFPADELRLCFLPATPVCDVCAALTFFFFPFPPSPRQNVGLLHYRQTYS